MIDLNELDNLQASGALFPSETLWRLRKMIPDIVAELRAARAVVEAANRQGLDKTAFACAHSFCEPCVACALTAYSEIVKDTP